MPRADQRSETLVSEIPSFSRILLVTDFSAASVAAAPFAALVAHYYRAPIIVAHVLTPEAEAGNKPENETATAEAQLEQYISGTPVGETEHEGFIGRGPVWEVLADLVRDKGIDLVVLGTRGRSGVGKLLMGSVAQRIFSLAPCPVMTVSPRARRSWGPDQKLARILYATDFSSEALTALPYALSVARASGAEVVLLHAPDVGETISDDIAIGYQQHLGALIPPQARTWCHFDTMVIPGEPGRAIVEAAAKNAADLIVIGARAYEGSLSKFQVPLSIAYRVVAHAPCPVLRVRS